MNPALKARMLVLVFWVLGMPLTALSFVAIPQALGPGALAARLSWGVVPVLGLCICTASIVALLRNDARAGGASFDRRWLGRYYMEILIAFILYLLLFAVSVELAHAAPDPRVRILIGVAPVFGLASMLIAVVRLVRHADDYHRARLLESFAATAAVTALWTSGYSFLESVGFPPLHLFWIPLSMTVTWAAWSLGRALLGR